MHWLLIGCWDDGRGSQQCMQMRGVYKTPFSTKNGKLDSFWLFIYMTLAFCKSKLLKMGFKVQVFENNTHIDANLWNGVYYVFTYIGCFHGSVWMGIVVCIQNLNLFRSSTSSSCERTLNDWRNPASMTWKKCVVSPDNLVMIFWLNITRSVFFFFYSLKKKGEN